MRVKSAKSAFSWMLSVLFLACLLLPATYAQSTPSFQSVSGEFAQKWLKDYKQINPGPVHEVDGNGSDLWSWGNAPKGSEIVDGNLVTDPYYLRPLLNLSSDWMGETYTDASTGLPMETYSDHLTGKKIYRFLNPTTGKPFFTYYTYLDAKTGQMVYAYVDPLTGKEVFASTAPIDIINILAGRLTDQTVYNQNEPWTRL
ncbi:MAG: hypothetical protein JW999_05100 [Methanotrichaceae archaeon]|nr:hypothetical protein [Methanotrichaceae archaeon]